MRKTAVAILVPKFSYFNFHMNFSCKLTVYIYIYVFSMKIENKLYSIFIISCAIAWMYCNRILIGILMSTREQPLR